MATSRRRVAVLGPGRVGSALAQALTRGGDRIVAVMDGGGGSAVALASQIAGCVVASNPVEAVAKATHVLVTAPDDAIVALVTEVALADGWHEGQHVVHCSGAAGLAVLERARLSGARVAACHPAQTVPRGAGADDLLGVAWAVTAAPSDRAWAHDLVTAAGGDPFDLSEDARVLYHAALSIGSNAVGAAVAVARQLLLGARVDAPDRILTPLIEASVRNVLADGAGALTGPVVRGDVGTVARHLGALDGDVPRLGQAYRSLQSVVLDQVAGGLSGDDAAAIRALLADGRQEQPWNE